MHKIFDLKEMDLDQLHNLAAELKIKGFKKLQKDDLVYAILDEEARQNALNTPDKPAKPKRGRPKKTEKPAAAQTEQEIAPAATAVEEKVVEKKEEAKTVQPKKRGRKPKAVEQKAVETKPEQAVVETVVEKPAEDTESKETPEQPRQPRQKRNRIQKGQLNKSAEPVKEQKEDPVVAEPQASAKEDVAESRKEDTVPQDNKI